MYLKTIHLKNIRCFHNFELRFDAPFAGWHVIIGDNASGKSSLLKAIALGFLDKDLTGVKPYIRNFLRDGTELGEIKIKLFSDPQYDLGSKNGIRNIALILENGIDDLLNNPPDPLDKKVYINRTFQLKKNNEFEWRSLTQPFPDLWTQGGGWFCASYGPFRRIDTRKSPAASDEWEELYQDDFFLAPHISLFNQNILFSSLIAWLRELRFKELEGKNSKTLTYLLKLINEGQLLAPGFKIHEISSDGVLFKTPQGAHVPLIQLSDGYRSVLSLTFDLIRQLLRKYGEEKVFQKISQGVMAIDLPGIVLIDEIDSHLHPTWQVRIGKWFTSIFPQLQFIVTTHSPLICQSAESGSIWRLASPDADTPSEQITGEAYQHLVYGNILEAYGTELFGENIMRSEMAKNQLERLSQLNLQSLYAELSPEEEAERSELQKHFPTQSHALHME